ncbi:hypothetical protein C2869_09675 [Saccharobesus litoralis]|uniref:Protein kinase domain-containing protein n=1 Tax=Saccharobesus litoralis TaxID=2172099 RepID=A0A2S0VR75_9ALTE|nr:hypothetical protein [Saccharobesus litoralis]AWB66682.1 hypothetical protein C2869_09675 [Saccharobesus litoralis]
MRIQMSDRLRTWLKDSPILPEQFTLKSASGNSSSRYQIQERDESGKVSNVSGRIGFKGFVLKVKDIDTHAIYAAKFTIPQDYDHSRDEFHESRLATLLQPASNLFSIPKSCGRVKFFEGMPKEDCFDEFVCFISDWVEGETLESLLNRRDDIVSPYFASKLSIQLNKALGFLNRVNLKHDDLHYGNVMVLTPERDLIFDDEDRDQLNIKVIDTGSLKPYKQENSKPYDDLLHYTKILVDIFNVLIKNRRTVSNNRLFFEHFERVIKSLNCDDPQRFFPNLYADIQSELKKLEHYLSYQDSEFEETFHPFDAISAEQLASDQMLLDLFVDNIPWMDDVTSKASIVLTGPRGCGKSMMLRYLSVRAHLHNQTGNLEQIQSLPFFGVFVSCATELQNSLSIFSRDKSGDLLDKYSDEVVTFFNIVVARELFRSIASVKKNQVASNYFCILDSTEEELVNITKSYLGDDWLSRRFSGTPLSWQAAESLDKLRLKLSASMLNGTKTCKKLPDNYLAELTSSLSSSSRYFRVNPVAFLLDDYTSYRIPIDVQKLINKIVFERRASHIFKISCEKYGFSPKDNSNIRIEADREFHEIDAGAHLLSALGLAETTSAKRRKDAQHFIENLIDRRLRMAKWSGTTKSLIGKSDYDTYISVARAIHANKGVKNESIYHGLEVLADIWSGDIATILQVARTMFSLAQVKKVTTKQISKAVQHRSIVNISRSYLERIEAFHPNGPELQEVVRNFGATVTNLLIHGDLVNKKSKSINPRMVPRIEMTLDFGDDLMLQLKEQNPLAAQVAKELLRRAIFIELDHGRSKESNKKGTLRWEFRRIYLPGAGAALGKNHYIEIKTVKELIMLLTDQAQFKSIMDGRYLKNKGMDDLFSEEYETEDG